MYISLVEIKGSRLPAFGFMVEEKDVDDAAVCMASMKALREATEGATIDS